MNRLATTTQRLQGNDFDSKSDIQYILLKKSFAPREQYSKFS